MHKITKIEEEKLCEVMEIIEKAATLMEENDLKPSTISDEDINEFRQPLIFVNLWNGISWINIKI